MRIFPKLIVSVACVLVVGCATAPPESATGGKDAWALFDAACAVGADIHSVTGSVWLKARSQDASGQFPALVEAHAPDRLTLEVTNLIGASQAVIAVTGSHYVITQPDSSKPGGSTTQEGRDSWGGIPLRWAADLFVGRIPCPTSASVKSGASLSVSDGQLTVATRESGERFVYQFRSWGGKPWPESLHWERASPAGASPLAVDFKFDDPEDLTGSPRKWEAKSSQGEIKARWRERKLGG